MGQTSLRSPRHEGTSQAGKPRTHCSLLSCGGSGVNREALSLLNRFSRARGFVPQGVAKWTCSTSGSRSTSKSAAFPPGSRRLSFKIGTFGV